MIVLPLFVHDINHYDSPDGKIPEQARKLA